MAMETKKTFGIYYSLLLTIVICCYAEQMSAQEVAKSKPNKPDVRIKVNKEFDDKGNLTRFDSTYSYSWSDNGQIPMNADSIFNQFNHSFSFGGDVDSVFNQFGFGTPFFNQPFTHSKEQFDKFFKGNQLPADSMFYSNPNDFFKRDYREILKQQQQLMDQFLKQMYPKGDPRLSPPNDSIPLKIKPQDNFKPEKQDYLQGRRSDKAIII